MGGESVELGNGDFDFEMGVKAIQNINYEGLIILQAYRNDEGIEIFDKQYKFF